MADPQQLALLLVDRILDGVRSAAGETNSLARVVAHICHIDHGDAQSAAIYLKEFGFSGHADRLTQDVDRLKESATDAFRGPFVAEPTDVDREQEQSSLRSLHSEAHRLLRFLNDLQSLISESVKPDDTGRRPSRTRRRKSVAARDNARIWQTMLDTMLEHHCSAKEKPPRPMTQKQLAVKLEIAPKQVREVLKANAWSWKGYKDCASETNFPEVVDGKRNPMKAARQLLSAEIGDR